MALLEIRGLRKTYATGERALDGVDVSVGAKQVVAILGLSGSGKSTLLRCINRLVEPDEGSVVLDGTDVTSLDLRAMRRTRRRMGMIFQEFNLVERLTVLEQRAVRPVGVHVHVAGDHARLPPARTSSTHCICAIASG